MSGEYIRSILITAFCLLIRSAYCLLIKKMTGLLTHLWLTLKLNFRSKQAIVYGYVVPIFFLYAFGSVFKSDKTLIHEMGQLLTVTVLGGACFGMPTAMVNERERGV